MTMAGIPIITTVADLRALRNTYPRDLNHDVEVITDFVAAKFQGSSEKKVDAIFHPTVSQMYPSGFSMERSQQRGAFVEVLGVSEPLEGKTRPSFFRGVSTVVAKLLNATNPTTAYFGQKDIQQTVVLKTMVRDLLMDVQLEIVPTVRNISGLALSSRNAYLSPEILSQVTCIFRSMNTAYAKYSKNGVRDVSVLTEKVSDGITSTNPNFRVDYISFNDPETLEYLATIDPKKGAILSLAIYVPNSTEKNESKTTRLIDNMIFTPIA
ncbi:hypothetical protein PMKS-002941 [Pichia membranifaciens]|uniref:Pantoate--beta-alanine ligase n=1 Tax=Pichia membranifaciens TaxID=4926 RepID=A0A1Q2YIZ2_9ASCO|nr:hypothetical protein PMKS-002941 [Pichia membranifaciens]